MKHLKIRFAGYGGYGVVTASRILGLAFAQKGYHVLQTESHGAAARGGACTADLTISSNPIYELTFEIPDVLIILSTPAFKKCCSISPDLSSKLLLIETDILEEPPVKIGLSELSNRTGTAVYHISIRKIAEELGHVRYMGIASLGALAAVDTRIDMKLIEYTIKSDSKLRRFQKENLKALLAGSNAVISLNPKLGNIHLKM
ncbi:MAG: 2-oxoacid:acceptor oxidoreductase family protein [Candidatus Thorarchaeota archaeon]